MNSDNARKTQNTEPVLENGLTDRENIAARLQYFENRSSETRNAERPVEIHLRTYIERVLRHKWIVIVVAVMLTTLSGVYLLRQPDIYKAQARIQVDSESAAGFSRTVKDPSPFDDRAYFNTQLELLQSPALILRVIKKLDLEHNQDFITNDFIEPDTWQSKFKWATGYFTRAESSQIAQANANSDTMIPLIKAIQGGISVDAVLQARQNIKDTRLISISFYHPKSQISVMVSNAVADELVNSNLKNKTAANNNENDYLQNNITDLRAQIHRDEQKLLVFARNYQLPSQDSSQNTVVERLVGLNRQLLEAENLRKQAEAELLEARKPGVADAQAESGAKQINDIDNRLDELRQRRAQLLVEVTEKYPDVVEIDKQIGVLEKQAAARRERATTLFRTNVETRYRQALFREESIRDSFDKQRGETLGQNEAAINYRIIQQSLETNKKLFDEMSVREKENEMLKAKLPNNIRVIDYAMTPTDPIDPKYIPFLGLTFIFSFTLGIGGALLRDYFDDTVHSTEEVETMLSLPALAVIPQFNKQIVGFKRPSALGDDLHITPSNEDEPLNDSEAELLFDADMHSPLAEAFRRLRTALILSPAVGELKKILVTSSQQSEGKTTTAVNIATSLAQTGAKVLIIDADFRSPRLQKIFDVPDENGLSDVFTRDVEKGELFAKLIKQRNLLYVLPAGSSPVNSAECLGSNRMRELLATLEQTFDYIVIDSPPVVNFVDSTILAAMADGVLFVVQGNRSSREMVRQSTKILRTVGAKIVGVVLNKVSVTPNNYYRSEVY